MTGVVTHERIWWCMGPVPQTMRTRWPQDVVDPPSSGWHAVLVYRPNRSDAKFAQVFDPATGWGRDVALESMELNGSKPYAEFDEAKMVARIQRVCATNDKLGVGMSYGKANFFLEKLGAQPYVRINAASDEEEGERKEKAPKEPKVDPRAGMVTAGDIAAKLGVEPRILRDACRKLKIEKPALGWCGSQAWADDIEKRVRAFLAQPATDDRKTKALPEQPAKGGPKKGKKK